MALELDHEPIGPIGPLWRPDDWKMIPVLAATVAAVIALIMVVPVGTSTFTAEGGHVHTEVAAATMIHLSDDGLTPLAVQVPVGSTAEVMNVGDRTQTLTVGAATGSLQVTVESGGSRPLDLSALEPGAYVLTDGASAGTLTITG